MAEKEYYRLTRSRRRNEGFRLTLGLKRASLWMGSDHLLSISEGSYSEEYKRFYFRDIQAITVCLTRRRAMWNVALPTLMMVSFAILQMITSAGIAAAVSGVLFGVPLLVNNIRGTSCKVYLRTMVQTEELSSLDRVRRAHRILDRIRPLISTAQGQLTVEELSRRMTERSSIDVAAASVPHFTEETH